MPELTATLSAMYKKESRSNKFMAQLQGVNLDDAETGSDGSDTKPLTFQEIQARAAARVTGSEELSSAIEYGFTPDLGVGYKILRSNKE